MLDSNYSLTHALIAGNIVSGRENEHLAHVIDRFTRQRVNDGDSFNSVTEHFDASDRLVVSRLHLDGVATNTEISTSKGHVVAVVLQVYKSSQQTSLVVIDANVKFQEVSAVLLWVAHSVDTTH